MLASVPRLIICGSSNRSRTTGLTTRRQMTMVQPILDHATFEIIPRSLALRYPIIPMIARAWSVVRSKHSSAGFAAPTRVTLPLVNRSQATPFSMSPSTSSITTLRGIRHASSIGMPLAEADAANATACRIERERALLGNLTVGFAMNCPTGLMTTDLISAISSTKRLVGSRATDSASGIELTHFPSNQDTRRQARRAQVRLGRREPRMRARNPLE